MQQRGSGGRLRRDRLQVAQQLRDEIFEIGLLHALQPLGGRDGPDSRF